MKAARRYDSPLRAAHVDQTRERILRAAADLAGEVGVGDLTIPMVASRAGVSAQTVYRHYRTVTELMEAFGQSLLLASAGSDMRTPIAADELPGFIRRAYVTFDGQEPMLRAYLAARAAGRRQFDPGERNRFVHATLAPLLEGLPAEQARRAVAAMRLLTSIGTWQTLRDTWHVDGREAGEMAAWVAEVLLAELRRRPRTRGRRAVQR
jgi:AcrR family transcriptional regulator